MTHKSLSRGKDKEYRVLIGGNVKVIPRDIFNKQNDIDGVIRIVDMEYSGIDTTKNKYTHFNLEHSGHKVGGIYVLPRIVQPGYYRNEDDKQSPVLSFDNCLVMKCVAVRENVPYSALSPGDFTNAMSFIRSVEDLQKVIVRRYRRILPDVPEDKMLSLGVSITTLEILKDRKFVLKIN
ncbi:MAG: hypothetical protein HZA95_02945 [Candidatus Vogelbacteria bacterium]|nr:hypothetical protein [Candidatus Vogelbacteria bacterium]